MYFSAVLNPQPPTSTYAFYTILTFCSEKKNSIMLRYPKIAQILKLIE